jgi:hypothetical protein
MKNNDSVIFINFRFWFLIHSFILNNHFFSRRTRVLGCAVQTRRDSGVLITSSFGGVLSILLLTTCKFSSFLQ